MYPTERQSRIRFSFRLRNLTERQASETLELFPDATPKRNRRWSGLYAPLRLEENNVSRIQPLLDRIKPDLGSCELWMSIFAVDSAFELPVPEWLNRMARQVRPPLGFSYTVVPGDDPAVCDPTELGEHYYCELRHESTDAASAIRTALETNKFSWRRGECDGGLVTHTPLTPDTEIDTLSAVLSAAGITSSCLSIVCALDTYSDCWGLEVPDFVRSAHWLLPAGLLFRARLWERQEDRDEREAEREKNEQEPGTEESRTDI